MPLVTVAGRFELPDDTPAAAGTMTWWLTPSDVPDTVEPVTVLAGPVAAPIDETGAFTVDLRATDDPALTEHVNGALVYRVRRTGTLGYGEWDVTVPAPGPWDWTELSPAPNGHGAVTPVPGPVGPPGPVSTVPGPQGPQGDQGDQGIQGVQGIQGDQGIQGVQGIQGEVGPTGAPGNQLAGFAPALAGRTSEYWGMPVTKGTGTQTAGVMTTFAVYVPFTVTIDRIGAEITTLAAGATVTLGIYSDTGTGLPGALLLDAGTINAGVVGGAEITINQVLAGNALYHFAALPAGGNPVMRSLAAGWVGSNTSLINALGTAFRPGRNRGATGTALPNPAGPTNLASNMPSIAVRLA